MQLHLLSRLRNVFSGKPRDKQSTTNRKPHSKPTVRRLTSEQAKLKIIGHAMMGNQGAKELMELLFRNTAQKPSYSEKKSA